MDFFARQEAARRATRWLLAAFLSSVVLVAVSVGALVYVFVGTREAGETATGPAIAAAVITLLVVCGASLYKTLALRAGGGVVARSLGGTRVERTSQDLALRRLHNVVEEMAIASGVSMPEVYVLDAEDGINAFAAGSSPRDAAVAVTRGALTRLNREQLQGVIAHEFSHILNGDMRLNSKLLGWVFGLLVVAIAARMFLQGASHGSRRRDKGGGGLAMVALIVMVVGYIGVFVGRILQAAVSRHRERLADASAVQFTRNPSGLVGALLKIAGVSSGSRLVSPDREEVAHMLFAPGMARLFSTHPRLEERLRALDPTLARQDLDRLAGAAAREAEQLRLAPDFEDLGMARTVPLSPLDTAAAPGHVTRLAGTLDERQVQYAHDARRLLPEALRAAGDSPDEARVLLFALLRATDEAVASRQDGLIRARYGESLLARVQGALPAVRALPGELRLPAVQQLLPALRRMTLEERQELQQVAHTIALADERMDVFECCLTLLLEAALREDIDREAEHGRGLARQFAGALQVLFAVLAAHGARDGADARSAYEAGIGRVLPAGSAPFAPVPHWPAALQESLRALAGLRPAEKKSVVEGLVCTIAHDRRLAVSEAELLRTVCALLHCPLPPILSGEARS